MHRRLIDTLYTDAMLLADEARSYIDATGRVERELLDPMSRVAFSCESLKVTTRLMHIIAWLLTQRAIDAGEQLACNASDPRRRLGPSPDSDATVIVAMPWQAQALIVSSQDIYRRVARLEESQTADAMPVSPARSMLDRLAMAF